MRCIRSGSSGAAWVKPISRIGTGAAPPIRQTRGCRHTLSARWRHGQRSLSPLALPDVERTIACPCAVASDPSHAPTLRNASPVAWLHRNCDRTTARCRKWRRVASFIRSPTCRPRKCRRTARHRRSAAQYRFRPPSLPVAATAHHRASPDDAPAAGCDAHFGSGINCGLRINRPPRQMASAGKIKGLA